jgi:hypothetical protein
MAQMSSFIIQRSSETGIALFRKEIQSNLK